MRKKAMFGPIKGENARLIIEEKCSIITCNEKPIIEIVTWDGITLDTHLYLCRKHWEKKTQEEGEYNIKIIHSIKDLRSYL